MNVKELHQDTKAISTALLFKLKILLYFQSSDQPGRYLK